MNTEPDLLQLSYLRQAIDLAQEASLRGNLPIGAVIVLDGVIIARGMNAIWKPEKSLTRHAEMESLRGVTPGLWERAGEMTLYSTLEPCVMCAGAILLHGIGQVIYGSADPYGGVGAALGSLPPFFSERHAHTRWDGPALPAECDPLYRRVRGLEGF
jgi:tRNA(adenine34) deaminase